MTQIRDIALAPSGRLKIDWVRRNMPLLRGLEDEFSMSRPFTGMKIALSVHLEAKTAYLCQVLAAGGADMWITGSNPLSTQDDVAAALASYEVPAQFLSNPAPAHLNIFAWHGATPKEYEQHIRAVLEAGSNLIIDDGGDLVGMLHTDYPQLIPNVIGGCEETTTGILRLQAMERAGELRFPMIRVNDADCKHLFDNRYGTGQSVFDGIDRTTNLIIAGKTVVVAGYGWCGKGVAMRAKGLGANVVVTEVDPIKALEAHMDGFTCAEMSVAAKLGDLFITVTGCSDVITAEHFPLMKDGAILCNAGHFDVEVSIRALEKLAVEKKEMRQNIMGYRLPNGRWVHLLAEGRLVNLAAGDGHPAEIMDMSFAIQALSAAWLAKNRNELGPQKLLAVPREIDLEVARRKLASLGRKIDALTPAQKKYLYGE